MIRLGLGKCNCFEGGKNDPTNSRQKETPISALSWLPAWLPGHKNTSFWLAPPAQFAVIPFSSFSSVRDASSKMPSWEFCFTSASCIREMVSDCICACMCYIYIYTLHYITLHSIALHYITLLYIHTHACMHAYIHTPIHPYMHACIHIHMHTS